MPAPSESNARPEYEGYQRPSVSRALLGIVAAVVILIVALIIAVLLLPRMAALFLVPGIGLIVIVALAGMAVWWRERSQPEVPEEAKAHKREAFESWMDEELDVQRSDAADDA